MREFQAGSRDPTNPLDETLGYWLRRASMRMMGDLAPRLQPLNLSIAEASILLFIQENPGITQSAVGRHLGIQRANIAPMIGRLSAQGWVQRDPADGRAQPLSVTGEGAVTADIASEIISEHETECGSLLSRAETMILLELLPRLIKADD